MSAKLSVLSAFVFAVFPFAAYAGFDFVAPANQAPSAQAPVLTPDEAMPAQKPGVVVIDPVLPVLEEQPLITQPAASPADQPADISSSVQKSVDPAASQNPKKSVYPPPGNGPAAPLMRNTVADTGLIPPADVDVKAQVDQPMPTPPVTAQQMEADAKGQALPPVGAPTVASTTDDLAQNPATKVISYDVVRGFGKDIPMSLAVDQVVPQGYKVVYEDRSATSVNVSWSGERPWNVVLDDMLAAHGFAAIIRDSVVTITRTGPDRLSKMDIEPQAIAPAAGGDMIPGMIKAGLKPMDISSASYTQGTTDALPTTYDAGRQMNFSARAGESLRGVLQAWSDQAHVQLYWKTEQKDITVQKRLSVNGKTYAQAVSTLLDQFRGKDERPVARLHPNEPNGPAILVIEQKVEQPSLAVK